MTTVSVKEARANISLLLDRAEHGEEIMVTRHGKEIARIVGAVTHKNDMPRLGAFRKTIKVTGMPLSRSVMMNRREERN